LRTRAALVRHRNGDRQPTRARGRQQVIEEWAGKLAADLDGLLRRVQRTFDGSLLGVEAGELADRLEAGPPRAT
jgi:hypothetical protein